MLMTPVLRGMMAVAPMHVVTKPVAGTGGSYMQDITAAIAIGERCPVLSLTLNNDEENEKRLSSAALTGQPIIAIDNFTGTLMGDFLCQLIERPMPQIRLLGKLRTGDHHQQPLRRRQRQQRDDRRRHRAPHRADQPRRQCGKPGDPHLHAQSGRRGAGRSRPLYRRHPHHRPRLPRRRLPGKLPPRLSFEDWSDNVRSALVWLGWPDPDESIKAVRAADPISAKLHAVIAAWATDLTVGIGYFTSELVAEASEYLPHSADRIRPALWDALFAVAGSKTGQLDVARLGLWLQAHLNRISAGHKLLVDRTNKARPRWRLEPR